MKMDFKKIILLSFLFLAVGVFYYWHKSSTVADRPEPWITFKKTSPKKIDSYPTTYQEKAKARIDPVPLPRPDQNGRTPASVAPAQKKQRLSIPGRHWNLHSNQAVPEKISFLNKPKKEWKELMGQDVMRFLRPDTKLFVRKEKSLTLLKRDGGLHVEQVYIKMISPEGKYYSYHAYVDSESGKIVKTWNRTIHEPMGEEEEQKFRPSGFINPDGVQQF